MSRVLVGVDGSEDSRMALRWAATLAAAWGAPLRALWAWQYPEGAMLSSGSHDLPDPHDADELVEEQLRRLVADELGEGHTNVTVEAGRGPGAAALLRAATQGPRMVVVGSRGLGGFKGLLLGSVSQQLCEHAPCPVTVVRRMAPVQPVRFETIVVGIDGSVDAARALRFAADLATKVGAELVVANAAGPGDGVHQRDMEPSADLEARRELVATWCAPLKASGVGFRAVVVRAMRERRCSTSLTRSRQTCWWWVPAAAVSSRSSCWAASPARSRGTANCRSPWCRMPGRPSGRP